MTLSPEHQALLAALNRPLLPELPINLIDALAAAFSLQRRVNPQRTAQHFLEDALTLGILDITDTCRRVLHSNKPKHTVIHGIPYP